MLILVGLLAADWLAEIICPGEGLILIPRGRQTNIVNKIPIYQDRKSYNDNKIPINK